MPFRHNLVCALTSVRRLRNTKATVVAGESHSARKLLAIIMCVLAPTHDVSWNLYK